MHDGSFDISPGYFGRLYRGAVMLCGALALICLMTAAPLRAEDDQNPVVVGMLTGPAPYYGFNDATGEPIGFALDMWIDVARRAGISYQVIYFDTIAALRKAVENKAVDVVPLLSVDDQNSAIFDFTEAVHVSQVVIFTRKGVNDINRLKDLAGHRVSVVAGHVGQPLMRAFRGELSITHDSLEEALSALMTKTSDAVIHQSDVMWQQARKQGVDSLLKIVGKPLRQLELAIAVRKDRSLLLATLTPALQSYKKSSAYYAAREPWGGNPPPWIAPEVLIRALVSLLAISVIGFALWRHVSVVRLNQALAKSIREQQSAEARFKDVAEAASDWFFEQDRNLRFTFVSSRFEEVTGIKPERLIGQTRWDDAARDGVDIENDKWREHIATLGNHEDWRDFTYELTTRNGEKRTVTTSGKAIFDPTGDFIGYRGVGRDITRRIELEGALQQAQKMELVGQLTGGIAHDFNNLLTVMVGNIEMLRRNISDTTKVQGYLNTTSEAVEIGTRLVQRLLGFSRRQSLNPDSLDLNELVSEVMPLVRSSAGAAIEISLSLGRELPAVFADETQLQNALLNLAINARDAMPDGGRLTIETLALDVDQAFIDQHPPAVPGRYLVLRVRDTGCGIARKDLAKVIEPFYTTKEVGHGSGLGLSMVYGFAQQSGGFLLIESEIAKGTVVSIYLPGSATEARPRAPRTTPAEMETTPSPVANHRTVLVVEDDHRVREVTTSRLRYLGYTVIDVENAAAAIDALNGSDTIDLVLTDIMMPGGMSGIDLAREVQSRWPDIKILFSAAYSKQADMMHERGELGPWLRKPYRQADLSEKLDELLNA